MYCKHCGSLLSIAQATHSPICTSCHKKRMLRVHGNWEDKIKPSTYY